MICAGDSITAQAWSGSMLEDESDDAFLDNLLEESTEELARIDFLPSDVMDHDGHRRSLLEGIALAHGLRAREQPPFEEVTEADFSPDPGRPWRRV